MDSLKKLAELQNVEIVSAMKNNNVVINDERFFQVETTITIFDMENIGDRGPYIKKRVVAFALDVDLETAQDKALDKAYSLLINN